HLRARDEMAARRSLCPRCGAPVGIPSREPTHRGTNLGPMSLVESTPTQQITTITAISSRDLGARPGLPNQGRQTVPQLRRGWRDRRWVERHWYDSLPLPRRAWPLVLGLAFALTGVSGGIALSLPRWFSILRAEGTWLLWLCLPLASIPLAILGYGSG